MRQKTPVKMTASIFVFVARYGISIVFNLVFVRYVNPNVTVTAIQHDLNWMSNTL